MVMGGSQGPLQCPRCRTVLPKGQPLGKCPQCGLSLADHFTPLQTGMLTDFGAGLVGGIMGVLSGVTVGLHLPSLPPGFGGILGGALGWSLARFHIGSVPSGKRFRREQWWVSGLIGSIFFFWLTVIGCPLIGSVAGGLVGFSGGWLFCRSSRKRWRIRR